MPEPSPPPDAKLGPKPLKRMTFEERRELAQRLAAALKANELRRPNGTAAEASD